MSVADVVFAVVVVAWVVGLAWLIRTIRCERGSWLARNPDAHRRARNPMRRHRG